MASKATWNKWGLRLACETSKRPLPKVAQPGPAPDFGQAVSPLIQVLLEPHPLNGQEGIRILSVGNQALPSVGNTSWAIQHAAHYVDDPPPVLTWESIDLGPISFLNYYLSPVLLKATHRFRLVGTTAQGQVTTYPEVAITTPNEDAFTGPLSGLGSDWKITDQTRADYRRWVATYRAQWQAAWDAALTRFGTVTADMISLRDGAWKPSYGYFAPVLYLVPGFVDDTTGYDGSQTYDGYGSVNLGATPVNRTGTWTLVPGGTAWNKKGYFDTYLAGLNNSPLALQALISAAPASVSQPGMVKPGAGLSVDPTGLLTVPMASTTVLGLVKVDGITITINPVTGIISTPGGSSGVSSFNTRTGAVSLISSDVTSALGYTPLAAITGAMIISALGYTPLSGTKVDSFNSRTGAVSLISSDVTSALGYTPLGSLSGAQIVTALGYTPANKAGDQFTGSVGFGAAPGTNPIVIPDTKYYAWKVGSSEPAGIRYTDATQKVSFFIYSADRFTVDASGNGVLAGGLTATTGAFSSTITAGTSIVGNNGATKYLYLAPGTASGAVVVLDSTGSTPLMTVANSGATTFNNTVAAVSFNGITGLSSSTPLMNGTAAVGPDTTTARGLHVHPSDTTRLWNAYLLNQSVADANTIVQGVNVQYLNGAHMPGTPDFALFTQAYNASWATQLASDWRTNNWYVRALNNGTWGNWANIFTTANLNNNAAAIQAVAASLSAPMVGTYAQMVAFGPPSGTTPYWYATDVMAPDGLYGRLYKWNGSSWVDQGNPQTVVGRVVAGVISAGAIGAQALAATIILGTTIQTTSMTHGAAGSQPVGVCIYGTATSSTFFDGTSALVSMELGDGINFGGYNLSNLAVGKLANGGILEMTTAGTYSWKCPRAITQVEVTLVAGGGSGGRTGASQAAGGGGGGAVRKLLNVTPGVTYTIVVGSGGPAQANGNPGSDGSNSTFNGGTLVAYGGKGGCNPSAGVGGQGGQGGSQAGAAAAGSTIPAGGFATMLSSGGAGGGSNGTTGGSCGEFAGGGNNASGGASAMGSGGPSSSGYGSPGSGNGSGGGATTAVSGFSSGAGAPGYALLRW